MGYCRTEKKLLINELKKDNIERLTKDELIDYIVKKEADKVFFLNEMTVLEAVNIAIESGVIVEKYNYTVIENDINERKIRKNVNVDIKKLKELRKKGYKRSEIAKRLDVSIATVQMYLKKLGLANHKVIPVELIKKYLNQGYNVREIRKKTGTSLSVIYKYRKEIKNAI